jgi:hypothetical protein
VKFRDLVAHALLALAVTVGSDDFAQWLLDSAKQVEAEVNARNNSEGVPGE